MADSKLRIILTLVDKLTPNLRKTQKGVDKTTSSLDKMAKKLVLAAGGFVLFKKAFNITKESALLAARFETMGVVVNNLGKSVGVSSVEMGRLGKAMEETGISMIGARESIAKLIQADIDLAHATDLARVAQDGAVIAGTNSTEALGKLIGFISTGNIRVARQIGLFIDLRTAYKEWGIENDRTVASLTEQEKAQIRAVAAIKAGERITGTYTAAMKTAGKQLGSLERDVENFKVTFGKLFTEAMAEGVPAMRLFFQGLTTSLQVMLDLKDSTFVLGQEVLALWQGELRLADGTKLTILEYQRLHAVWRETKDDAILVAESFDKVKTTIAELAPPPEVLKETDFLMKKWEGIREQIDITRGASETLWGSMNAGILGAINKLQSLIDFQQAGGAGVQAAFENIQSALSAGLIDPEEAKSALKEVELAALAVDTEIGNIDMEDAIAQVRDEYNVSWEEANQLILNAKQFIDAIPAVTEKKIEFFIEYTGADFPGFQHGGSFIVPGRGGPDSTPVGFMATPGERVTIESGDHSTRNLEGANLTIQMSGVGDVDSFLEELGRRTRQAVSAGAGFAGA